jgi:ubiquinone/menaquinone biosynthesis C-methylase UbiE
VPLGIETGVDPSGEMLRRGADRGITAIKGVGEALPLAEETFETALVVTTICFVDDIEQVLTETRRILRPGGQLVVGYIDKEAPLGERYLERKDDNPFYENATFVSTSELIDALETVGFGDFEFVQTMFRMPEELTEPDRVTDGYGEGSFVGIGARRQE